MNIDNKLEKLGRIRPVEAPAFLYTRIKQQIDALAQAPAPARWKLSFAGAAVLLLCLNIGILFRSGSPKKNQGLEQMVGTMQLSTSNDLYHE